MGAAVKIATTFVLIVLLKKIGVKIFKDKSYSECIKDGDFKEEEVQKVGVRIDHKEVK